MNLQAAELLANRLIRQYLPAPGTYPNSWTFKFNRKKSAFGTCNYTHKTIQLSKYLTETETDDAIEQTLRHEIAHAIAGHEAGHGPQWKAVAAALGVRRAAATRDVSAPTNIKPKWVMVFGKTVVREYHRKPGQRTFNDIHLYSVRGKPETRGQLSLMSYNQFQNYARN